MNTFKKGMSFALGFWAGTAVAYFGAKMLDEYLINNNDNYRKWRNKDTVDDSSNENEDDEEDIFDEEIAAEWEEK